MTTFLIGLCAGAILVLLVYIAVTVHTMAKEMTAMANVQKLIVVEQGRLRQIGETTLEAAETFVDALRESSRHMMPPGHNMNDMHPDTFDDLRETFQNGIRDFEEEDNNEEEDGDDNFPQEPWKRGT